jgi:hypothetical protein
MENTEIINNAEKVKTESVKDNKKSVKKAVAEKKAKDFAKNEFEKSIDKLNLQTATKTNGSNYDHNYINLKHNLSFKTVLKTKNFNSVCINCVKIGLLTYEQIETIILSADWGKEKISRGDFKSLYKSLRTFYRLQRDEKNNLKLTNEERKIHESNFLFYKLINEKRNA